MISCGRLRETVDQMAHALLRRGCHRHHDPIDLRQAIPRQEDRRPRQARRASPIRVEAELFERLARSSK